MAGLLGRIEEVNTSNTLLSDEFIPEFSTLQSDAADLFDTLANEAVKIYDTGSYREDQLYLGDAEVNHGRAVGVVTGLLVARMHRARTEINRDRFIIRHVQVTHELPPIEGRKLQAVKAQTIGESTLNMREGPTYGEMQRAKIFKTLLDDIVAYRAQ